MSERGHSSCKTMLRMYTSRFPADTNAPSGNPYRVLCLEYFRRPREEGQASPASAFTSRIQVERFKFNLFLRIY